MAIYTQIQPVTFPILGIGRFIVVKCENFELGATKVDLTYRILDNVDLENGPPFEGKVLVSETLEMANSDLQTWGADDNVAIDWVINKLNLTKK